MISNFFSVWTQSNYTLMCTSFRTKIQHEKGLKIDEIILSEDLQREKENERIKCRFRLNYENMQIIIYVSL